MKRFGLAVLMAAMAVMVSGCIMQGYPLMAGEKVIFRNADRANAYREWSGNDMNRTGAVVEITRPTSMRIF